MLAWLAFLYATSLSHLWFSKRIDIAGLNLPLRLVMQGQAGASTPEDVLEDEVSQPAAAGTDEAAAESCTLYIKNLAFVTAEEGLQVRSASFHPSA